MRYNHGYNQGCCGSQRAGNRNGNDNGNCVMRGPFNAIDAACIPPQVITGSIIPFASGAVPMALTSVLGGLVSTAAFVGFGTSIPSAGALGATIDLTGLLNEAFSVPRPGTITAISASITLTAALTLVGSTTVNAQIYRAPAGSNTFTPTGVAVAIPLPAVLAIGDTFAGASSGFPPVPVSVGDRLLMVYSTTTPGGATIAEVVAGSASAGITIA